MPCCTEHEIAAITGHASLREVQRYTRAADQTRLALAAMAKVKTRTGSELTWPQGLSLLPKKLRNQKPDLKVTAPARLGVGTARAVAPASRLFLGKTHRQKTNRSGKRPVPTIAQVLPRTRAVI